MSTTSKTYLITVRPYRSLGRPCARYLTPAVRARLQGANKGLGLGLVGAVLAKQPASTVIATVREPFAAKDLLALQKANAGRLEIVKLDVADEASVKVRSRPPRPGSPPSTPQRADRCATSPLEQAVAEEVAALPIVKENGIDALVLNAGLNAGAGSTVSTMCVPPLFSDTPPPPWPRQGQRLPSRTLPPSGSLPTWRPTSA